MLRLLQSLELFNLNQVLHPIDDSSQLWCIFLDYRLIQPAQAQTPYVIPLSFAGANSALCPGYF